MVGRWYHTILTYTLTPTSQRTRAVAPPGQKVASWNRNFDKTDNGIFHAATGSSDGLARTVSTLSIWCWIWRRAARERELGSLLQFASHVVECHNFSLGSSSFSKRLLCVTASCCIWSTQRTRRRSLHELRRRSWSWHSKFWRLVHPDGNAGRAWWSSFCAERILSFVRDEFGHCLQKGAWCSQTV